MTSGLPVSVRTHFDRFPATLKGAFVIRGTDRDPHQVVFREARAVAIGGGEGRQLGIARTTLDVAPRRDVFIPFELSVTDLEPGWYELECDLDVDGVSGTFPGGRRFSVPWPRATVRRGQVRVDRAVRLPDGGTVTVEEVECGGDVSRVHLAGLPPTPVSVRLFADGARLEVLEADLDPEGGRGKLTAYPLLRSHEVLRIELSSGRGRGRGGEASIEIVLP